MYSLLLTWQIMQIYIVNNKLYIRFLMSHNMFKDDIIIKDVYFSHPMSKSKLSWLYFIQFSYAISINITYLTTTSQYLSIEDLESKSSNVLVFFSQNFHIFLLNFQWWYPQVRILHKLKVQILVRFYRVR